MSQSCMGSRPEARLPWKRPKANRGLGREGRVGGGTPVFDMSVMPDMT